MRVFTREQMNHRDIDQAFATHTHNSNSCPKSTTNSHSFFSPDNLIIVLLIILLLIESKEKNTTSLS